MAEHLTREQISALLDEPETAPDGAAHLGACGECAREYERMSRMRMALSALPDLEPPAGEWEQIRARLAASGAARRLDRSGWWTAARWPLQVAAVALLFAAGLYIGQRGSQGMQSRDKASALAGGQRAPAAYAEPLDSDAGAAYVRSVAALQRLREATPSREEWTDDPAAVAERITHLDAIIEASQEALREAPADPVLNNFLFDVVDERETLAGRLDETLHLTAAEY